MTKAEVTEIITKLGNYLVTLNSEDVDYRAGTAVMFLDRGEFSSNLVKACGSLQCNNEKFVIIEAIERIIPIKDIFEGLKE